MISVQVYEPGTYELEGDLNLGEHVGCSFVDVILNLQLVQSTASSIVIHPIMWTGVCPCPETTKDELTVL